MKAPEHRRRRRSLACFVMTGGLIASAAGAGATPGVTSRRLAGEDRFETSRAVATASFSQAPVVIVAAGESFPDALAAAYLAGLDRAPVLLAQNNNLPADLLAGLVALGTRGVQLVGGTGALTDGVQNELRSRGYVVDRLAGNDRLATAAAIARVAPPSAVGTFPGRGRTAVVVRADDFPDALVGGPIAYARGFPIILTSTDTLSTDADTTLAALGIRHVLMLGGTAAVSEAVKGQIEARGIVVRRISGLTRAATAVAVADLALDELGFTGTHVNLARGDTFPDALVGAAHAGEERAPIVLATDPDTLDPATVEFLNRRQAFVATIDVFGGMGAISDATAAAARRAAGGS